jgi:hypothetical protein
MAALATQTRPIVLVSYVQWVQLVPYAVAQDCLLAHVVHCKHRVPALKPLVAVIASITVARVPNPEERALSLLVKVRDVVDERGWRAWRFAVC